VACHKRCLPDDCLLLMRRALVFQRGGKSYLNARLPVGCAILPARAFSSPGAGVGPFPSRNHKLFPQDSSGKPAACDPQLRFAIWRQPRRKQPPNHQSVVGKNPEQVNFIKGSPGIRIDSSGNLIDPWGTPYFFHQLSGMEMEIHSAGPDKIMWTQDDLVLK